MFHELSVSGFKAWRGGEREGDSCRVRLGRFTLLLGENSAGKTSLLQPLLLLKQTAEAKERSTVLNLGGQPDDSVDVGSFGEAVSVGLHGVKLGCGFGPVSFAEPRRKAQVKFTAGFSLDTAGAIVADHTEYEFEEQAIAVRRQAKGAYQLKVAGENYGASRTYAPSRAIDFSRDARDRLGARASDIEDCTKALRRALAGMQYLGPLRARPDRFYEWRGAKTNHVGDDGRYAIPTLVTCANAGGGDEPLGPEVITKVSAWLKEMRLAEGLEVRPNKRGSTIFEVRVRRRGGSPNLLDVGFGLSQVLPVLVLAHVAPKGSTLILEQPELHLHPLAQSFLADLMVEVGSARKLQFIVETHSEHLFRRLQTLVAKGLANDARVTPDDCALYFVKQDAAGWSQLATLELDRYGRVANWPEHFFGDAMGEAEAQVRARMEREPSAGVKRRA